jgi:hypothetical protein
MIDVLWQVGTPKNLTGTLVLTPFYSVTVPGGLLDINGQLRINMAYSHNNSVNNKTISATLGGATIFTDTETNASLTQSVTIRVRNAGSMTQQLVSGNPSSEFQPAAFAGTVNTSVNIDLSRNQTLSFWGLLTNIADNISLDAWSVEFLTSAAPRA